MTYGYKVIELINHSHKIENVLNEFGECGYKLVNFLEIEDHVQIILEVME